MKYYVDRKFMPLQHAPVSINIAPFFLRSAPRRSEDDVLQRRQPSGCWISCKLGDPASISWGNRHANDGSVQHPLPSAHGAALQDCPAHPKPTRRCKKLQIVGRLQSARSLSTFVGACQVYDVLDQGQLCGQVDFRCRHDVVNVYAAFGTVGCFFLARYQSKSGETSDLAYCCQTQQANERTEKISQFFFPNKRPASNNRDSLRTGLDNGGLFPETFSGNRAAKNRENSPGSCCHH